MFYNTGEHLQQVSFSVSVHISRLGLPRFACHRVSTNGLHHCVELEKLFSLGFCFTRFEVRKVNHSELLFRPERVLRLDFCVSNSWLSGTNRSGGLWNPPERIYYSGSPVSFFSRSQPSTQFDQTVTSAPPN